MELTTRLSQDRFDWMKDEMGRADRASMLVEVVAPELEERTEATPTALVVVLDRSGSMGGERLQHAKRALQDVVERLSPADSFGLVVFDHQVSVPVPAGPLADKAAVRRAIEAVHPGGSTDLGAGLVEGLRQARRLDAGTGVRLLLVSDGHANQGVVDADVLGGHVGRHLEHRVTTSTLGMGLGYDETLLSAIARAGSGNEHFAAEADTAAGVIAQECGDLLAQRFLSCRLSIKPGSGMQSMEVVNEVTAHEGAAGLSIDLGGLMPGERRLLVVDFLPWPATRPGRRKVAKVRLDYVLADDLSDQEASTSVWGHVVRPGGRDPVVDREVVAEAIFQRVQRRKRRGMLALARGDFAEAVKMLQGAARLIERSSSSIPRDRRAEMEAELELIEQAVRHAQHGSTDQRSRTSKSMSMSIDMASRKRGRGPR